MESQSVSQRCKVSISWSARLCEQSGAALSNKAASLPSSLPSTPNTEYQFHIKVFFIHISIVDSFSPKLSSCLFSSNIGSVTITIPSGGAVPSCFRGNSCVTQASLYLPVWWNVGTALVWSQVLELEKHLV